MRVRDFVGHADALTPETEVLLALGPAQDLPGLEHLAGSAVVTRRRADRGTGAAWLVAGVLPEDDLASVLHRALADAGVAPPLLGAPAGVEVTRRGDALFVLNHTRAEVHLEVAELARALGLDPASALLTDLLTARQFTTTDTSVALAPQDVLVSMETR